MGWHTLGSGMNFLYGPEPYDDRAAKWYESFGATRLDDAPLTLVLPLKTIATAIGATI